MTPEEFVQSHAASSNLTYEEARNQLLERTQELHNLLMTSFAWRHTEHGSAHWIGVVNDVCDVRNLIRRSPLHPTQVQESAE